jgi:uncharacterized protein
VSQHRHQELIAVVLATPWLAQALDAGASLNLASWCIGAGAIRNAVWDHLHGYAAPSALSDIDFAYFDADDLSKSAENEVQGRLESALPGVPWEATNQAAVHLWFEGHFGHPVAPLASLYESVASWPEYATSVAVWYSRKRAIEVIAPHGLEDLFAMRVRRNPTRVSLETYAQRIDQKQYTKRWPRVTVVPCMRPNRSLKLTRYGVRSLRAPSQLWYCPSARKQHMPPRPA